MKIINGMNLYHPLTKEEIQQNQQNYNQNPTISLPSDCTSTFSDPLADQPEAGSIEWVSLSGDFEVCTQKNEYLAPTIIITDVKSGSKITIGFKDIPKLQNFLQVVSTAKDVQEDITSEFLVCNDINKTTLYPKKSIKNITEAASGIFITTLIVMLGKKIYNMVTENRPFKYIR